MTQQQTSANAVNSNPISDQIEDAQDFLVTNDGICHPFFPEEFVPPREPYRLYRFLTDLEDILATQPSDEQRIRQIIPLVRTLLTSSEWLQMEYLDPHPEKGWSVKFLYREPHFPITVQMVSWEPGRRSTIHNHGTWGIVALIGGEEKNTFWRPVIEDRLQESVQPDLDPSKRVEGSISGHIEPIGNQILVPGDIIGLMPEAIHCVEPAGREPAISFNLYGVTQYKRRFEFDPKTRTAKNF